MQVYLLISCQCFRHDASSCKSGETVYQEILKKFTSFFPLWAVLLSAVAYICPEYFAPHQGLIVPFLSLIMLGMGVTLSVDSFLAVFKRPSVVLLGTLMQYTIMPLAAMDSLPGSETSCRPGGGRDPAGLLSGRHGFQCDLLS